MKLAQYLKRKGMSGLEFSKLSGVKQRTISKVVQDIGGGGGITLRTALKIVKATSGQVSVYDLPTRAVPIAKGTTNGKN